MATKSFQDFLSPTKLSYLDGKPTTIHLRKCRIVTQQIANRREWVFEHGVITIGSLDDNNLVIKDDTVSRYHAEIIQEDDTYIIRDLESTNGTWVNQVRIKEAYLTEGCSLRFGQAEFIFQPLDEEVAVVPSNEEKFGDIIGGNVKMREIYGILEKIAPTNATVVIEGETGTGKEVIAHTLHKMSMRAKKPFVVFDCGAVPESLIESELFGHEKGSFTGAAVSKKGLFEMANNGTIFLDEIGDMSLAAQSKVLRVLQNGEYMRVGAEKLSYVDVRVIAATNKDLKKCVADGTFREDLYFRLNVVPIHVPPLRDRLTDVPLLLNAFLAQIAAEYGRTPLSVTDRASELLGQYTYPGNIRELHNICERFVIMCQERVTVDDLPDEVLKLDQKQSNTPANSKPAPIDTNDDDNPMQRLATITPGSMSLRTFRNVAEHAFIRATLNAAAQNVAKAAEILGIERTNLHKKIKKYESNSFDTDESED